GRRSSPKTGHHHLGAELFVAALYRRVAPGMKALASETIEPFAGERRPCPGRSEVGGLSSLCARADPQDVDRGLATLARAHAGGRPALEKLRVGKAVGDAVFDIPDGQV